MANAFTNSPAGQAIIAATVFFAVASFLWFEVSRQGKVRFAAFVVNKMRGFIVTQIVLYFVLYLATAVSAGVSLCLNGDNEGTYNSNEITGIWVWGGVMLGLAVVVLLWLASSGFVQEVLQEAYDGRQTA